MPDKLDVGGGETTGSDDTNGDECAAISETADVGIQPADIIVVVDNSGSMEFEANAVQSNLNAFSSQIFLADIDYRVVLLSALPPDDAGICVNPPLGAGTCPNDDTNLPGYLHVDQGVGSENALEVLLSRWPDYASSMRPGAAKHIVVVSDDNSSLAANDFVTQFMALDPNNAGFKLHGIVADADPVSSCLTGGACCAISAAAGTVYMNLINQTGGLFGNLCDQEFQPIFDELATQVIEGATLSCEYAIPAPPDDMEFDPDKVNVEFDDGNGGTLAIGRVDSADECAGVTDGWYYDDPANPTTIYVCSQTCDKIQGFQTASVSIQFGCETIPAG
jgi:hypothetical protein